MRRSITRVGPWLFIFTIIWCFSGNHLIKRLNDKSWSLAKSQHESIREFELDSVKELIFGIYEQNDLYLDVTVIYDGSISKLRVENENLGVRVDGQVNDGSINLRVAKIVPGHIRYGARITVRVPLSIQHFTIMAPWPIKITAGESTVVGHMNILIPDSRGNLTIEEIDIGDLTIETRGSGNTAYRKSKANVNIGDNVKIERLSVSMLGGRFDFSSSTIPQGVRFSVSDSVVISGSRGFLSSMRFEDK